MGITVEHDYFAMEDEAKKEVEADKLFLSVSKLSPSEGTPMHWHDFRIHVYIQEGTFRFQDPSTGQIHECRPGTKFVIPPRTLHIEEAHDGYSAIIGLSVDPQNLPQPVIRQPEELEA